MKPDHHFLVPYLVSQDRIHYAVVATWNGSTNIATLEDGIDSLKAGRNRLRRWKAMPHKREQSVEQRCRVLGIDARLVRQRMYHKGMSFEQAIVNPTPMGHSIEQRARARGLNPTTIRRRMSRKGLTFDQAVALLDIKA